MKDHLTRILAELTALRMLYDKTGNVRFPLYMDLTQAEEALHKALEKTIDTEPGRLYDNKPTDWGENSPGPYPSERR